MKIKEYHFQFKKNSLEKYPSCSAAKRMVTKIPIAEKNDSVGAILKKIRDNIKGFNTIDYVYVINGNENLVGVVSIKNLFKHSKEIRIEKIMHKKLITVSPETDQEKVADLAVKHAIKAIPVIENKKLIGVVPIEEILPILNKALREDVLHLAGIHKAHLKYENTLEAPLFASTLHRIPYLLVGLMGIIFAAMFIDFFESILEEYLILAFFIPAIVYMSDSLGTQHQTLFIRDLALMGKELNLKFYFLKQMIIGSLLAVIISSIIFLVIDIFWREPFMALVISTAMFFTLVLTSFTALLITLIINKFNLDPALGSGPIATIISDVTSIVVYFGIAVILLVRI